MTIHPEEPIKKSKQTIGQETGAAASHNKMKAIHPGIRVEQVQGRGVSGPERWPRLQVT